MNKVMVGVIVGAVLGLIDGATAWFTPEVRSQMASILIGSTVKGIIAGVAAGWYARKVQSTVAGIIFGLVVGAALAFAVCQLQGGKYYFEIMLPGSIVGAIVGWATQRYGRTSRSNATAAVASLALMFAMNAHAAKPITASDAFAKLKSLDGTWTGHIIKADGPPATVTYRVSSGGSTVMETLFGGTPHEMITMYTVDGDDLVASHYCSAGNQPVMKLNRAKSSPGELVFEFVTLHGSGAHVHDGVLRFDGDDKLVATWSMNAPDGGKADGPHVFYLTRAR